MKRAFFPLIPPSLSPFFPQLATPLLIIKATTSEPTSFPDFTDASPPMSLPSRSEYNPLAMTQSTLIDAHGFILNLLKQWLEASADIVLCLPTITRTSRLLEALPR